MIVIDNNVWIKEDIKNIYAYVYFPEQTTNPENITGAMYSGSNGYLIGLTSHDFIQYKLENSYYPLMITAERLEDIKKSMSSRIRIQNKIKAVTNKRLMSEVLRVMYRRKHNWQHHNNGF